MLSSISAYLFHAKRTNSRKITFLTPVSCVCCVLFAFSTCVALETALSPTRAQLIGSRSSVVGWRTTGSREAEIIGSYQIREKNGFFFIAVEKDTVRYAPACRPIQRALYMLQKRSSRCKKCAAAAFLTKG